MGILDAPAYSRPQTNTRIRNDLAPRIRVPFAIGASATRISSALTTSGSGSIPMYASRAVVDVVLTYANTNTGVAPTTGDAEGATDIVLGAAIYYNGAMTRAFFGRDKQATIKPGAEVSSDPIAVYIPAGAVFYVVTFMASGTWYGAWTNNADGGAAWVLTTDLTAPGSSLPAWTPGSQPAGFPGPVEVTGKLAASDTGPLDAIVAFGDSIDWGTNDGPDGRPAWNAANSKLGRAGYVGRAAATLGLGQVRTAMPADLAQRASVIANTWARRRHLRGGTWCVENYGRNDFSGGRSFAQWEADVITIWLMLQQHGLRTVRTTVTPWTTSTDGWTTTANQTIVGGAGEAERLLANAWLRDGAPIDASNAPMATGTGSGSARRCAVYDKTGVKIVSASGTVAHPLAAVVDVAGTVESASDPGKWDVSTVVRQANDGAATSGQFGASSVTLAMTTAELGYGILIAGAGAAGANYFVMPWRTTSASAFSTTTAVGTTVTGANIKLLAAITTDGTHPGPMGYDRCAVPLVAALTALMV